MDKYSAIEINLFECRSNIPVREEIPLDAVAAIKLFFISGGNEKRDRKESWPASRVWVCGKNNQVEKPVSSQSFALQLTLGN